MYEVRGEGWGRVCGVYGRGDVDGWGCLCAGILEGFVCGGVGVGIYVCFLWVWRLCVCLWRCGVGVFFVGMGVFVCGNVGVVVAACVSICAPEQAHVRFPFSADRSPGRKLILTSSFSPLPSPASYSFESSCPFTLLQDSTHGTFSVNLKSKDDCTGSSCSKAIHLFLDDEEYVLQNTGEGEGRGSFFLECYLSLFEVLLDSFWCVACVLSMCHLSLSGMLLDWSVT